MAGCLPGTAQNRALKVRVSTVLRSRLADFFSHTPGSTLQVRSLAFIVKSVCYIRLRFFFMPSVGYSYYCFLSQRPFTLLSQGLPVLYTRFCVLNLEQDPADLDMKPASNHYTYTSTFAHLDKAHRRRCLLNPWTFGGTSAVGFLGEASTSIIQQGDLRSERAAHPRYEGSEDGEAGNTRTTPEANSTRRGHSELNYY